MPPTGYAGGGSWYGTITGKSSGYAEQLYFLSGSYIDADTKNVSNYTGDTGEYLRGGTWNAIKDINHLGDTTGNVFFHYQ